MTQVSGYIKLKEVVYLYSEASMQSDAKFLRLWRIAFRGLSFFGMSSTWQPKTVSIPINPNRTATFPNDYIQWVKVGMIDGGKITTLRNNQSLINGSEWYSGVADVVNHDIWFSGFVPVGRSDKYAAIEFKVNKNHLAFDTNFTGKSVLLEYLCSPERDDDFEIPIQFQEAMISWLRLQDNMDSPRKGFNATILGRQFASQLAVAKKLWKPFRISEVVGGVSEYLQSEGAGVSDLATTAAVAPICPTVNIDFGATNITVVWTADANAIGYTVTLYSDAGITEVVKREVSASPYSTNFTGLTQGAFYWVRVQPINKTELCGLVQVQTTPIFSPLSLGGLWAGYESDLGVSIAPSLLAGGTVLQWNDQSGNGNHLISESGKEPELVVGVINGLSVVKRGSIDAKMATVANFPNITAAGSNGLTVFMVVSQSNAGGLDANGCFISSLGLRNIRIRRYGGLSEISAGANTASGSEFLGPAISESTFYTIRLRTNNVNQYLSINNGTETIMANSPVTYLGYPLHVFALANSLYGNKSFASLWICAQNLGTTAISNMEAYLRTKYAHY